jgi:hypothetical protein
MSPKTAAEILPIVRALFSERPEFADHEPWELVHVLYSLNFVDELLGEGELAVAVEVAKTDWTGGEAA